jgi:hypothetical protein
MEGIISALEKLISAFEVPSDAVRELGKAGRSECRSDC